MLAWLCILASWPSSLKAECPVTATGVCTPGVEETIVEDIIETTEHGADGYTIITETTTTTTTTTVTTEDSGDILDGDNNFVSSTKEGDMDSDWGGQGPANMPSGGNCYALGTDKCAQITGSGNSTSSMGVSGMGTTFINTVDISSLDIENGGRTNYTIKVDKRDAQDRIYMHITGRDGKTNVFSGTDILSESGVASGFQEYAGGFDFSGTITTLIIEVGGRDINLAIGPLFDDISINVLYNVVETIVNQTITTVEMWVSMGGSTETEVIDIVENIFEHNDIVIDAPNDDMYFDQVFLKQTYREQIREKFEGKMVIARWPRPDYNEDEVRKGLRNVGRTMENYKLRTLQEYGARIDDYIQGRVMQSKELSREIGEAIKDAAVASGIPADRMVIFDEINMVDMFGARETSKSIRNWDTARATFINRNPKDPLSRVAAGTTQGLYIPAQSHYKGLRSSIYIALHPLINRRYGGGGEIVSEFASAMGKTFRHESFHAVQEYLDQLHMTKHLDALNQPEAIDEMVKLIKKHGGDYSPTMNNLEIQAESYGIWATIRKAKLTKGGIVKTSFERLKKYLSEFRRKLNIIRGKDPTYIDVFELAAQGKIARQARINKLTPVQMDELIPSLNAWTQTELPDLTLRIFNYLEAKKIEYDNLVSTTQNKFFTEGC